MLTVEAQPQGYLREQRIVDLTDHRGVAAAHMLARMGADVIQVEPLAGTTARAVPPFCEAALPENSLYWAAYGAGKRSVACAIETAAGKARLLELIASADFLFDSASPGRLDRLGLDWATLSRVNPRLIQVSITPFGAAGPKAHYADSDLILWAAGGALRNCRDAEGTPLRISVPQAYLNASADAAVAALIAHHARIANGVGQRVEIRAQLSVAQCTLSSVLAEAVGHDDFDFMRSAETRSAKPALDLSGSGVRTRRSKWPVRDGLVEFHLGLGRAAGGSANAMSAWMQEEGMLDPGFAEWDWISLPDRITRGEIDADALERARAAAGAFLARFTKDELLEQAMRRRLLLAPIATTVDLLASPQLAARGFLLRQPDAPAGPITLPGNFAYGCADGFAPLRPAPRLGEHDDAVWRDPPRDAGAAPRAKGAASAALAGLKVLDLAWVVAGPSIGRVLADYGADVVRVESRKRVDTARLMGPFPGGAVDPEHSALYDNCNAGKWGLALDLSQPAGRQVIRDLASWADVVVESFASGQMRKWELDYATLRCLNPSLIMVSTSLMGGTGPHAGVAGYGNIGAAVSGFQHIVGQPDKLPIGPYGPYTDYVGPRLALVALLAALDHRRTTGQGGHLDVSQAEVGIHFLAAALAASSLSGAPAPARGNRDEAMAPHGVFRCGDGEWVAIAVRDDDEWARLAGLIGAADGAWPGLADRKRCEDELEAMISRWTATMPAAQVERIVQALAIPAHVAVSSAGFCADPQIRRLDHIVPLPLPGDGVQHVEASRFALSATPARIARPAPTFGRDTEHVLKSFAGYDEAAIARLRDSGVLQ